MTIFRKQKFVWKKEIGGLEMDASPVKQWRRDHDILQKDLAALKQEKGLSSDYVLGFQRSLNDEEVA